MICLSGNSKMGPQKYHIQPKKNTEQSLKSYILNLVYFSTAKICISTLILFPFMSATQHKRPKKWNNSIKSPRNTLCIESCVIFI